MTAVQHELPQFDPLQRLVGEVHACVENLEALETNSTNAGTSLCHDVDEAAARLARYDLIVASLQADLQTLSRLRAETAKTRNLSKPPINRLPSEILCDIFLSVTQSGSVYYTGKRQPALVLSYTCTRWRAITLGYPELWSYINLSHLSSRLANLFIDRCDQSLLKMHGWTEKVADEDVYWTAQRHLYRAEELSVQFKDMDSWCFNSTYEPCSELSRLSLNYSPSDDDHETSEEDRIMDHRLFGGQHLPNLRHMSLSSCRFSWRRGRYKDLHTLKITDVRLTAVAGKDKNICWAIRESPLLHSLELYSNERYHSEPLTARQLQVLKSGTIRPVSLIHLHTVKLRMPFALAQWILSNMDAPAIRILHVEPLGDHDTLSAVGELLKLKPGLNIAPLLSCLRKLEVHVGMNAAKGGVSIELLGYNNLEEQSLRLTWSERDDSLMALYTVFQAIQSHGDLQTVKSLVLDAYETQDSLCLRQLEVYHGTIGVQLNALDPPEWPDLAFMTRSLPSLRHLKLQGFAHASITRREVHAAHLDSIKTLSKLQCLSIEGDLCEDCARCIWTWLLKLPSLESLEMGACRLFFSSNERANVYAHMIQDESGELSVTWPTFRVSPARDQSREEHRGS